MAEIYDYLTDTSAKVYRGGSGGSRRERTAAEWVSDGAEGGADPRSRQSRG